MGATSLSGKGLSNHKVVSSSFEGSHFVHIMPKIKCIHYVPS